MPKITYTFTQINQPSSTAVMEFNKHVHQLLKNPIYSQIKKEHNLSEVTNSTQLKLRN
ncbi:hypothetical protein [Pelosinus propionicus]|uniref:Uncharacterized protein n=1 Tax=Pelosinus propionicus DSM 13327 TaxID=1123291 RepID=A0A1I4Q3H2_9FIRM|nr:hypothetical protein [Pelosinus propionicus]SFM34629.1 hypothetical protein SAMN04490355_108210 [Pelosinus propionicus DSM 13327]